MILQKIRTKINQLEQSLIHNPNNPERAAIETDLRKLKQELQEQESTRTFERDTFDISEQKLHKNE
ncbi:TPA: hypothetical protein ACGGHC_001414 [Flavobacterium psychrophilum]